MNYRRFWLVFWLLACVAAMLSWRISYSQPAEIQTYSAPDSLLPWCYDGFTGAAAWRYPGLTASDLWGMGILIACDCKRMDYYHSNCGQYNITMVPVAFVNDSIPPVMTGWHDNDSSYGHYEIPEGTPDLYYELTLRIATGEFEGDHELPEEVAWGYWSFNMYTFHEDVTWDCCPPSLWPTPHGCVRILSHWYQDPDTLYWDHWWWQIRWSSESVWPNQMQGHWEIVGGIPGGGFWSPHLGPWLRNKLDRGQ